MPDDSAKTEGVHAGRAIRFIVLLGVVSLFADMTYEGARSVTGPYLSVLGASSAVVGVVAGFGELVGYGLRLVSGYISDRTGRYWAITLVGYFMNLVAVPLLALAGRWEAAAALIIAERTGKAIRTPARDAMLSHATHAVGRGWGFGLHEALDEIGAVLGPLLVAVVMYFRDGYRVGFAALGIPAVVALLILLAARFLYPNPSSFEVESITLKSRGTPKTFWIYLAAVALIAAGYADFPLIAYHFREAALVPDGLIPIMYSVAMAVDALSALAFGRLFDRVGLSALMIVSLIASFFAPFVFLGGLSLAVVGVALWGLGMGAQESIIRAAIADLVPSNRRASAYGVFNAGYGLSWFLGSALLGLLYEVSIIGVIVFSVSVQLMAVGVLWYVKRELAQAKL